MIIITLAVIGFLLSVYLLMIKRRLTKDRMYAPFCDLSDTITCSGVLKSEYADLFFLPNALVGLFFYAFIIGTHLLGWQLFVIAFSLFATIISIFLAGMLVTLKKACLVCIATYIINILLLLFSLQGVLF